MVLLAAALTQPVSISLLAVLSLGFFLGMRHATDADHVVAVSTIVSREKRIGSAAICSVAFLITTLAIQQWFIAR